MALIKCPECGHEMSDEALVCPYCGKSNQNIQSSVSFSKQIKVYAISLFLPPFGLWYTWKYYKQQDTQSRKISIISLVLTIISIIFTIWMARGLSNSINEALNSVNNIYNY